MRSISLFAFLFTSLTLAACGGEDVISKTEEPAARPSVNISFPDVTITQTTTVIQTSTTVVVNGCIDNPQVCGNGTMCDEATDRCVEFDPWAELNMRCPEFDYRITQLARTATNVYAPGDESLLFAIELQTCNWTELERVTVAIPLIPNTASPIFEYINLVENDQRKIGSASAVSSDGRVVIGLAGYQIPIGQRIKLGFYGKLRADVPDGYYGYFLHAMFARRIDDQIARLSTGHIEGVIQVRAPTLPPVECLANSVVTVSSAGGVDAPAGSAASADSWFDGGDQDVIITAAQFTVSGQNASSVDCLTIHDETGRIIDGRCGYTLPGLPSFAITFPGLNIRISAHGRIGVGLGVTYRISAVPNAQTMVSLVGLTLVGAQDDCDPGWTGSSVNVFYTR